MNHQNEAKPSFTQLPGESHKAFAAFRLYLELGDERTVTEVGKRLQKSYTLISRWAAHWRWNDRIRDFNAAQLKSEAAALDEQARKKAQEWAVREQAHREKRFQLGELLISKAREMLEFPVKRSVAKKGKHTTIIQPANWNFQQAARMLEIGDKLTGLAAGSPTAREEHTGKDGLPLPTSAGVVIVLPPKEPVKA